MTSWPSFGPCNLATYCTAAAAFNRAHNQPQPWITITPIGPLAAAFALLLWYHWTLISELKKRKRFRLWRRSRRRRWRRRSGRPAAVGCRGNGWHGDGGQAVTFGWNLGWRFRVITEHNEAVSIHQPWTISISASHLTPSLALCCTPNSNGVDSQQTLIALKRCRRHHTVRQSAKIWVWPIMQTAPHYCLALGHSGCFQENSCRSRFFRNGRTKTSG